MVRHIGSEWINMSQNYRSIVYLLFIEIYNYIILFIYCTLGLSMMALIREIVFFTVSKLHGEWDLLSLSYIPKY